jgi:hypothetical protein
VRAPFARPESLAVVLHDRAAEEPAEAHAADVENRVSPNARRPDFIEAAYPGAGVGGMLTAEKLAAVAQVESPTAKRSAAGSRSAPDREVTLLVASHAANQYLVSFALDQALLPVAP